MFLNTDHPIRTTILSLVVSFAVFATALWFLKPKWVQAIDKDGNEKVSAELVISFSITFALVVAILALLLVARSYRTIHAAPQAVGQTCEVATDGPLYF